MTKSIRLKSRRTAETGKLDMAEKYAARGVATGGGRIGTKKLRRTAEARFVSMVKGIPKSGRKTKAGRHHPPPSSPRTKRT